MNKRKEEKLKANKDIDKSIAELVLIFNSCNIQTKDIPHVLAGLLYSVGHALLKEPPETNEQILISYYEKPTLGTALMAQAIHMKETWKQKLEREEDK